MGLFGICQKLTRHRSSGRGASPPLARIEMCAPWSEIPGKKMKRHRLDCQWLDLFESDSNLSCFVR
jgi:hypothetical protein